MPFGVYSVMEPSKRLKVNQQRSPLFDITNGINTPSTYPNHVMRL